MRSTSQAGARYGKTCVLFVAAAIAVSFAPASSMAQINGPAPSVLSLPLSHFLPNPRPSVTSLGPFGYGPGLGVAQGAPNIYQFPYQSYPYNRQRSGHGRIGVSHGLGYGSYGYAIPYYVPYDASGYAYDYVPGTDPYGTPPPGVEPMPHMIVEQPPPHVRYDDHESRQQVPPPPVAAPEPPEPARSVEPTVLVFRDGRRQEVSNYAIMGEMVYVFDDHTRKIALAELDVAATIKANDDRGMQFTVPVAKEKKKQAPASQPKSPASDSSKPDSVA